jgi:type IV pilus assembly protein PilW
MMKSPRMNSPQIDSPQIESPQIKSPRFTAPSSAAGFTLIEVMIGVVLSSVILLGVSQLFVANSKTYKLLVGQSTLQESARFALGMMTRSAQAASYRGCVAPGEGLNKTSTDLLPYEYDLSNSMRGFDGNGASWSPSIAVIPSSIDGTNTNTYADLGLSTGIDTTTIQYNTDILNVTYINERQFRLSADMPGAADISVSGPSGTAAATDTETANSFPVNSLAMIYDCEKHTVFEVTGNAAGLIKHELSAGAYGNDRAALAPFNTYLTDAAVAPIISETYYIAPSLDLNRIGNYPLSLWRKTGVEAPVELIAGIEDLQLQYGMDTDNDGVPNVYRAPNATLDFDEAVALRVTVVTNSVDDVEATTPPTHGCTATPFYPTGQPCKDATIDGLLRRSFSQTIALRNRR